MDRSLLIVVDKKIPSEAKQTLRTYGVLMELETENITYEAISGHPDIFFFQQNKKNIVAPNLPEKYFRLLNRYGVKYQKGQKSIGSNYPESSYYNALHTSYGLLHNTRFTEPAVLKNAKNLIHCKQGYTRCNAIETGDIILTSDKGIFKTLEKHAIPALYTDPQNILLTGFQNGFIGGCCGIYKKQLFVCGQINQLTNSDPVRKLAEMKGIEIIELYEGKLFDGGGIFFMEMENN